MPSANNLPKISMTMRNGGNEEVGRALRLLASIVESGPDGAGILLEYSAIESSAPDISMMHFHLGVPVEAAKLEGVMVLLRSIKT